MNLQAHKKLIATAIRRDGRRRMAYFLSATENKPEQSELCSDVSLVTEITGNISQKINHYR